MTRHAIFLFAAAAMIGGGAPVYAQDVGADTQALIDQCSHPASDAVDSCLERARVAEETGPTNKDLQKLVAHLIELEVNAPASQAPSPPPDSASGGDTALPNEDSAPAIDTTEPAPPAPDNSSTADAPPDEQQTPPDMSPPDNTSPEPNPSDAEPPAPPAGSPHK